MKHINHKRKLIPLVILAAAALIASISLSGSNQFTGVVEATILPHISEVPGKIVKLPVDLGTHVAKGDVIAIIDKTDLEYSLKQLQLTLDQTRIALSEQESQSGSKASNSIAIARSNYNSAVSASQKATLDYQNAQELFTQGAITKDVLEKSKVAADTASNGVVSAKAQLDNAASGTPAESTRLELEKLESQQEEMLQNLDKYTIKAASNGVVMSKSYLPGDMISPGYNLVDLAADGENYFVFYLPVEDLYSMEYDQTYDVVSNGTSYRATVKYIDVKSNYTPKDMQTPANKNRKSIKVKLLLPKDCPLKPGQEAEVKI
ncbi:biotin/lipoyl-binding protein [Anoxybacterium hadale]|uniref:Biotin/lipoyl-binding protein n=1 Tax=Anoxybacterium hadale TaxID=3408580 RepID=A0ACD1AE58_9FIRM|nr:biotin/lipoyl-binding protein [Clostridiales bacterium]